MIAWRRSRSLLEKFTLSYRAAIRTQLDSGKDEWEACVSAFCGKERDKAGNANLPIGSAYMRVKG
jgi:hypothetical protein